MAPTGPDLSLSHQAARPNKRGRESRPVLPSIVLRDLTQILNDMVEEDINASSSTSDRFKIGEARSVIDRDIARLEETIRALKSRRNYLSPIFRLPPEILCRIFSFIEDRTVNQWQNLHPECWINFSRVSQQWRSLALSTSELWTNIPFQYPLWAQEMLRRSKMATLTVQVDFSYQTDSRSLDPIKSCLSQMIRLGKIDISATSASTLEKLFLDLPKSAPQLHTFCITINHFSESGFTIPEEFLTDTERLQCVHLQGCKIGWDSPLLTCLTRLTLHDSLKDNASTIQFLHALQRMPSLTNLDLEDSIPHDSRETSAYPVVDLPCLQLFRISSYVGAVTTALRHITVPSTVVMCLNCKDTQFTQINFSRFLSVLAAKFLSLLVFRSLRVTDILDGVRCQAAVQEFACPPSQLDLTLTWGTSLLPNDPRSYATVLTAVFDSMTLRALTHLHLLTPLAIANTWIKISAKLPLLEWVHLSYTAHSFLTALVHKTKGAEISIAAYRTVCFPKLRYICLNGNDFTGKNFSSISVDTLMECLMERCERNAEVQELHLENCYNLSEDDVEGLREIVVNVERDGIEEGFSEPEEERDYDSDGNIIDDEDYEDYYD